MREQVLRPDPAKTKVSDTKNYGKGAFDCQPKSGLIQPACGFEPWLTPPWIEPARLDCYRRNQLQEKIARMFSQAPMNLRARPIFSLNFAVGFLGLDI